MTKHQTTTFKSEVHQSFKLSLPLIATYLVQASSGFVGTIFLAHFGLDTLAAGALVNGIYMTIVVFLFGLLAAVSVLVAQNYGAKNDKGISWATSQGFIVSIFITVPTVILVWFSPILLQWSGQNAQVVALSAAYLHALVWGIVPLGFCVVMEQFLIGIGRTRLVLFVSLIEVPLEILGCYVLMFGKFGFPKLGIAGLAYGYAVVFMLVMVMLYLITAFGKHCRHYHIFAHVKEINWRYVWELFRVGTPIGVMYIIEVAFYMVMAFLMGRLGVKQLAAYQLVQQFAGYTFMIILAISQGATVQVGHAVGRNDRVGVKTAALASQTVAFIILFSMALIYWFSSAPLMSIDIDIHAAKNAELMRYAVLFFATMAFAQLGDTFRFLAIGALRGLKDTKIPLYVSAFVFWCVALPFAYGLAFHTSLGGMGLWAGLAIGIAVGAVILWRRFFKLLDSVDLEKMLLVRR